LTKGLRYSSIPVLCGYLNFLRTVDPGPFKKNLKVLVVFTTEPIKEPAVFDRSFEFFSIFRSIVVIPLSKLGLSSILSENHNYES